jgi:hypothetical protein
MGILIGMDEAGYGPNLGPLVVAATAWEVPDVASDFGAQDSEAGQMRGATATAVRPSKRRSHRDCVDLYRVLRNIVAKSASERRIAIADSKALYHPGLGLRQLERGLHAVLLTIGQPLTCWSAIVRHCQADPEGQHLRICWPDEFDCPLPVDAAADELARLGARLMRACDAAGVRPLAIRAKLVFPEQFNDLVAYYDSKGAALSHVTVGLLRELIDLLCTPAQSGSPPQPLASSPQSPIHAVCDKHGGRNYYTALLQHHFSEHWIAPVFESHVESHYEWGPPDAPVRVIFRMNGERFLPTALASMTAKYLRELAMRAFNEFWRAHVPNLRPTAGYYGDSRRFKNDIAAKQRQLGIDDHVLWRKR